MNKEFQQTLDGVKTNLDNIISIAETILPFPAFATASMSLMATLLAA